MYVELQEHTSNLHVMKKLNAGANISRSFQEGISKKRIENWEIEYD